MWWWMTQTCTQQAGMRPGCGGWMTQACANRKESEGVLVNDPDMHQQAAPPPTLGRLCTWISCSPGALNTRSTASDDGSEP